METSRYSEIDGKMAEEYRMTKLKEVEEKITADLKRHAQLLTSEPSAVL